MSLPEAKKRKVSKKTKKSWRKFVDVKDVDKFLENKRLDERLGAPYGDRTDDQLFAIDKQSSNDDRVLSKAERRLALRNKEAKCFAILKPHTAVPDPIAKRNRVKTPLERKNPITRRIEEERKAQGRLKFKEIVAKRNKSLAAAKRLNRHKRGEFEKQGDVWLEEEIHLPQLDKEWLTSDTVRHTLAHSVKKKRKIPNSVGKKTSILPAVEPPHPGISYNPSYQDHQEYLSSIAEKELALMKEEAHLERVTTKMFKKVSRAKKEEDNLREISEGLPLKSETQLTKNNDLDDDGSNEVKSVNPPVKNVKKTLQKRRKIKEQRALALKRQHEKVEKRKIADLYKLKMLKKKMEKEDGKIALLREKRLKLKEKKAKEPKVLSRVKFEPLDPVFKLGEELSGNLRNAAPAGSLLKDRFYSLQQRNILAPGTRLSKLNKAKVKVFQKADHKLQLPV